MDAFSAASSSARIFASSPWHLRRGPRRPPSQCRCRRRARWPRPPAGGGGRGPWRGSRRRLAPRKQGRSEWPATDQQATRTSPATDSCIAGAGSGEDSGGIMAAARTNDPTILRLKWLHCWRGAQNTNRSHFGTHSQS